MLRFAQCSRLANMSELHAIPHPSRLAPCHLPPGGRLLKGLCDMKKGTPDGVPSICYVSLLPQERTGNAQRMWRSQPGYQARIVSGNLPY